MLFADFLKYIRDKHVRVAYFNAYKNMVEDWKVYNVCDFYKPEGTVIDFMADIDKDDEPVISVAVMI